MKGSLLVPDTGPEPDLDLSDQEEEKQNDEMWTQSEPQSSSSKSSMSVSTKVVAGPPFGTHPIIRCAHQPSAAPSSILLPIVNFHRPRNPSTIGGGGDRGDRGGGARDDHHGRARSFFCLRLCCRGGTDLRTHTPLQHKAALFWRLAVAALCLFVASIPLYVNTLTCTGSSLLFPHLPRYWPSFTLNHWSPSTTLRGNHNILLAPAPLLRHYWPNPLPVFHPLQPSSHIPSVVTPYSIRCKPLFRFHPFVTFSSHSVRCKFLPTISFPTIPYTPHPESPVSRCTSDTKLRGTAFVLILMYEIFSQ